MVDWELAGGERAWEEIMWIRSMGMARWMVIVLLWMAAMVQTGFASNENGQERSNAMVVVETSEGTFKIELWADKAPVTVKNFLRYVDDGFYDGTIFHRVISDFMVQGGGLTPDMKEKKTRDAIKNEAAEELKNDRGTLAMARTNAIHSATSQFFINVVDNHFLNHKNKTPMGYGYAVFGKVVEGMDVVDKIRTVPTTTVGHFENVPATPVVITSIKRLQQE
jgi:cyclophilin family peptidyl-prolyl cis-trans isomerase